MTDPVGYPGVEIEAVPAEVVSVPGVATSIPSLISYPGVYLEELPPSVQSIPGVVTAAPLTVGWPAGGLDDGVHRLALYIEVCLSRGTEWVAFEPDGEALRAAVRASVEAFMDGLFRDGALSGTSAAEAYFVRCGPATMSQDDIGSGVLDIVVGFAPLRPAEFVVVRIQRITARPPD